MGPLTRSRKQFHRKNNIWYASCNIMFTYWFYLTFLSDEDWRAPNLSLLPLSSFTFIDLNYLQNYSRKREINVIQLFRKGRHVVNVPHAELDTHMRRSHMEQNSGFTAQYKYLLPRGILHSRVASWDNRFSIWNNYCKSTSRAAAVLYAMSKDGTNIHLFRAENTIKITRWRRVAPT